MGDAQRGSYKLAIVLCLAICLVLFYGAYRLKSHPSTEYDEGVYLTTFKSVQNGFPLYQQTYLSQLPGFFIATFPLYSAFGSNLEAARLAVFSYSLIGLMAIVWIGWELKSVLFSFIAIGVLYLIPIYVVEIMTFHADSLPSTFSALAIASILRFRNSTKRIWLVLSSLFVAAAILIKADVSTMPSICLIILVAALAERGRVEKIIQTFGIFFLCIMIAILLSVIPFGLGDVFNNVIKLRLQVASTSSLDPQLYIQYLRQQPQLMILLMAAIFLSGIIVFKSRARRVPIAVLFLWVLSTFIMLLFYQPLIPHHLVLLVVPITLFFCYALFVFLDGLPISRFVPVPVAIFIIIVLLGRLQYAPPYLGQIPSDAEVEGIKLIQKYTKTGDYIVSDDGIVTGLADRPVPPYLTDLSYVRIGSGNITPEEFEEALRVYKPKMILAWANRLIGMKNFTNMMQSNHYALISDDNSPQKAYVLEP